MYVHNERQNEKKNTIHQRFGISICAAITVRELIALFENFLFPMFGGHLG